MMQHRKTHVLHHAIMITLFSASMVDIYLQQKELSLFLSTIANGVWMYLLGD
jgi:hypothetical protein